MPVAYLKIVLRSLDGHDFDVAFAPHNIYRYRFRAPLKRQIHGRTSDFEVSEPVHTEARLVQFSQFPNSMIEIAPEIFPIFSH
jgi:hypothetical protein